MKKAIIFLGLLIVPVLFILFTAGCKKDDDSSTFGESGSVISGIVMDYEHNPVTNGEVHIITPEGRRNIGVGECDRTETIVETDDRGYFKAEFGQICQVVDGMEMLVFREDGTQIDEVYAGLPYFDFAQSVPDSFGFNSQTGMFFPGKHSYFTNYVEVVAAGKTDFEVEDTLYFLLPADPWEDKFWHIKKMPLVDFSGKEEFSFRYTNDLSCFLTWWKGRHEYHLFITDNRDLAQRSTEEVGSLPPVNPQALRMHNPIVLDFEMIEYPHQNIGGENRIYLTVKKENGKIVVKEQNQSIN